MAEPPPDRGADSRAEAPADVRPPPGLNAALDRNIAAVSQRRANDDAKASGGVRLSTRIGRLIGRMGFVYANLVVYAAWLGLSFWLIPGVAAFDREFNLIGAVASIEALFLAIIILITQNHEAAANDRRDDLNLQVNLLAEHELSQLIKLTIAIAEKLGIDAGRGEIADLQHDIHPDDVLDTIERAEDARKE